MVSIVVPVLDKKTKKNQRFISKVGLRDRISSCPYTDTSLYSDIELKKETRYSVLTNRKHRGQIRLLRIDREIDPIAIAKSLPKLPKVAANTCQVLKKKIVKSFGRTNSAIRYRQLCSATFKVVNGFYGIVLPSKTVAKRCENRHDRCN